MTAITTNIDPKDPAAPTKISLLGMRILANMPLTGWFVHNSFNGKSIEFSLLVDQKIAKTFDVSAFMAAVNTSDLAGGVKVTKFKPSNHSLISAFYSHIEFEPFSKFMEGRVCEAAGLDEDSSMRLAHYLSKEKTSVMKYFAFNEAIKRADTSGRSLEEEASRFFKIPAWKVQADKHEGALQARLLGCVDAKSITALQLQDQLYPFDATAHIKVPLDAKQVEDGPREISVSFNVQPELEAIVQHYACFYPQHDAPFHMGIEDPVRMGGDGFASDFPRSLGASGSHSFTANPSMFGHKEPRHINVFDPIMVEFIALILAQFQKYVSIDVVGISKSTLRHDGVGRIKGFTISLGNIKGEALDFTRVRLALCAALDTLGLTTACKPQRITVVNMNVTDKFFLDGITRSAQNPDEFMVNPRLVKFISNNPDTLQKLSSGEIIKIQPEYERVGDDFLSTGGVVVTTSYHPRYDDTQNPYHRVALAINQASPEEKIAFKHGAVELTFTKDGGGDFCSSIECDRRQVRSIAATMIQRIWRGHAAARRHMAEVGAEAQQEAATHRSAPR
ncbi:MAG: hypothetical protein COB66_05825 [Coxiella sp. (in: Bacteria)]|nr:MAG: hypothetical protein COB66_05825 [Coxiella sp. (in: g-proteobacteria)]